MSSTIINKNNDDDALMILQSHIHILQNMQMDKVRNDSCYNERMQLKKITEQYKDVYITDLKTPDQLLATIYILLSKFNMFDHFMETYAKYEYSKETIIHLLNTLADDTTLLKQIIETDIYDENPGIDMLKFSIKGQYKIAELMNILSKNNGNTYIKNKMKLISILKQKFKNNFEIIEDFINLLKKK